MSGRDADRLAEMMNHCPTCGAPARYLKIPHPEGEGTTIPLPLGALGGKWYHDCGSMRVALAPAGIGAEPDTVGDCSCGGHSHKHEPGCLIVTVIDGQQGELNESALIRAFHVYKHGHLGGEWRQSEEWARVRETVRAYLVAARTAL